MCCFKTHDVGKLSHTYVFKIYSTLAHPFWFLLCSTELRKNAVIYSRWLSGGITATNTFFRIVYKGPLWLPKSSAQSAIENGWKHVRASHARSTCKLYYPQNKIKSEWFRDTLARLWGSIWCPCPSLQGKEMASLLHSAKDSYDAACGATLQHLAVPTLECAHMN